MTSRHTSYILGRDGDDGRAERGGVRGVHPRVVVVTVPGAEQADEAAGEVERGGVVRHVDAPGGGGLRLPQHHVARQADLRPRGRGPGSPHFMLRFIRETGSFRERDFPGTPGPVRDAERGAEHPALRREVVQADDVRPLSRRGDQLAVAVFVSPRPAVALGIVMVFLLRNE
eukprot:gene4194-biopygen1023